MTLAAPARRPSIGLRRFGYALAAAINGVLLYLINAEPGWDAVPFLTADTRSVLPLVNFCLVASVVVNLLFLGYDAPRFTALGNLATTLAGLVLLARILAVFPFDFSDYSFDWALVVRVLLIVGIIGSAIGAVTHVVAGLRGGR